MKHLLLLGIAFVALNSCGSPADKNPQIFVPKVKDSLGRDLDELRAEACRGVNVEISENFLTQENINLIFDCANYDSSLNPIKSLVKNNSFSDFVKNLNKILGSKSTASLRETLRGWLEEDAEGFSRIDRLLPTLAKIIKNPALQEGLPVIHQILEAGTSVWPRLLPGIAEVLYQERFPDNYEDISYLFEIELSTSEKKDYSKNIKKWAAFLRSKPQGETIAYRALALANQVSRVEIRKSNLQEYLDQMNEKGVFTSLYLDSGAARGEKINPKLNADPDEEEIRDGLNLTPEERQERAYRKLYARGAKGGTPPIVQLASLVNEFHQPHGDFIPALARWFAANGAKLADNIFEYVIRAQVISAMSKVSLENYLNRYAAERGIDLAIRLSAEEYVRFLQSAYLEASFAIWIESEVFALNKEQFGERNADFLRKSLLTQEVVQMYRLPAVAEFGGTLSPTRPLGLNSLNKRYSNLHRGERLKIVWNKEAKGVDEHLVDMWWNASKSTLGEGVVVDFALKLAQMLFTEVANDISTKDMTLSEWYMSSPYSNPGTTESIAGYAFKEFDLLAKWREHKDYLKGQFATEVFAEESDRRAFRLLVDQVPHIWLYIKSGMARSGNDLSRAMASKDEGYLSKGYVDILSSAYREGLILEGVALIDAYHKAFPASRKELQAKDLQKTRRTSKGVDALKRVMRSLFEPEQEGIYERSTLGRLLVPLSSLVSERQRRVTEKFVLTAAGEILETSDKTINDFFGATGSKENKESELLKRREKIKTVSEMLADPDFPTVVRQLTGFFQDNAVRPAINFFAKNVDNGYLQNTLRFVRRLLGFRG